MSNKLTILGDIAKIADELDIAGHLSEAAQLDDLIVKASAFATKIIKIPDIRQYNEYSCGSACLLALLSYWGAYDGNEKALVKRLGTNSKEGTDSHMMARVAKDCGLKATVKYNCSINDIRSALDNGCPPIVNFQAWSNKKVKDWTSNWSDGHYAICVGMDSDRIYLRDPAIYNKTGYLDIDSFKDRWHDTGDNKQPIYRMAIFISGVVPDDDDSLAPVE